MYAIIQSPTHANAFRLPVICYLCSPLKHFGAGRSSTRCKKERIPREILYSVPEVALHVDPFCEGTLQDNVEVLKSLQHSDERIHHHVVS